MTICSIHGSIFDDLYREVEQHAYSTMLDQETAPNTIYGKSADSRVVRASTSGTVDLASIPSRVKPMTSKLVFTASLLDAQH